jgi:MFS family permease
LLIELGAGAWIISTVTVLTFLPTMILAPFSGVLIDKLPTKPFMVTLFVIEIATVLVLLLIDSLDLVWLLFIMIFIRMGAGSTYFQTEMSLLPRFLKDTDLKLANEIHSVIWSISYTAGMGLAGFFVYMYGVKSAFIADAALFLAGLMLLLGIKIPSIIRQKSERIFFMLKDGLVYLKNNPKIFHILILHACVGFASYDVIVALLADKAYYAILGAPLVIGFINSFRALALTLGQTMFSRFVNVKSFHLFFFAQGVSVIIWGALQFNFYIAFFGVFLAGLFSSTIWSYTYTMLQNSAAKEYHGRMIAFNDMFLMGTSACVSFLTGFLFNSGFGLSIITALLGVLFIVAGVYWMWVRKRFF